MVHATLPVNVNPKVEPIPDLVLQDMAYVVPVSILNLGLIALNF